MNHHPRQNCNTICFPPAPSLLFPPSIYNNYDSERGGEGDQLLSSNTNALETEKGKYLALIFEEQGAPCASMMDELISVLARVTERKYKPKPLFRRALACMLANVLRIEDHKEYTYGYHRMSPEGFRLLQVDYRNFRLIADGLEALGYIERKKGYKEHTGPGAKGEATRFKATPVLLSKLAEYGIVPAEWRSHFKRLPRPKAIPNPIVLKSASTWTGKGKRMPVDRNDPSVIDLAKPMDELNAFHHQQVIEPDCHYAFQRVFANGNKTGKDLDQGGRIYSTGDSYQHMPQGERALITINGEAIVELDITASHLTILHQCLNVAPPNRPDLYDIPGFDRGAIKTFVTMTLGYNKFHKDWTEEATSNYAKKREKKGLPPLALPPFNDVKYATLKALPILQGWPESLIRWGDLQYIESEAILEAIHTLATGYGVPAYPVHDSIIVPVSQRALAERTLADAFEKHVGVRPTIKAK